MKKLTYKEAYDKIIEAYFKDEIQPYEPRFCFCGTLCNNDSSWFGDSLSIKGRVARYGYKDFGSYTAKEYVKMEAALLIQLNDTHIWQADYEDALFIGMCAALEVLKQIHKERGEDVDGVQEFTKRKLQKNETTIIPN